MPLSHRKSTSVRLPAQLLSLAAGALASSLACSDAMLTGRTACQDPSSGDRLCESQVVVATWWSEDQPYLDSVGVESVTSLQTDPQQYESTKAAYEVEIAKRLEREQPLDFDVFLANDGADILRWTRCGPDPERSSLVALDEHFGSPWLSLNFPQELLSSISCGGNVFALPLGFYRLNNVFISQPLLESAGYSESDLHNLVWTSSEPEASAAEEAQDTAPDTALRSLGQVRLDLEQLGGEKPLFVVAKDAPHSFTWLLIENIMLAEVGAELYERFWRSLGRPEDGCTQPLEECTALRPLTRALDAARGLSFHFVNDEEAAFAALQAETAAMYVTGSWAQATHDLPTIAFPGTQQHFVFTADVFAVPRSADSSKGILWLHSAAGPQAQEEFARAKKAFPARADLRVPGQSGGLRHALSAYWADGESFHDLGEHLRCWLLSHAGQGTRYCEVSEITLGEQDTPWDRFDTSDEESADRATQQAYDLLLRYVEAQFQSKPKGAPIWDAEPANPNQGDSTNGQGGGR